MELKNLKPCPFCGSKDLEIFDLNGDDTCDAIKCNKCESHGPFTTLGIEAAVERWNTRSSNNEWGYAQKMTGLGADEAKVRSCVWCGEVSHIYYFKKRGYITCEAGCLVDLDGARLKRVMNVWAKEGDVLEAWNSRI